MYITFQIRIQDLVGTSVTDTAALTEWLTEEAVNAINIMGPEMLMSASSTHRVLDSEQFNDVGRTISTEYDSDATILVLSAGAFTATANCKEGSVISVGSSATAITSERMIITSITGTGGSARTLKVVRGVHGTTAATITSGLKVWVTHEKGFNTRKYKLLEVNRNGYQANPVLSGMSEQLLDGGSIYSPSKRSPSYYVKSGNIYIRPRCTMSEQGEIVGVNYPVVAYNMKSATDLPVEAEDFIVIGAARKYLIRSMYEEFAQLPDGITIPAVSGDASNLTTLEDLDTDNTIDVHADQIEYDQWFATAAHFIEDEEDIELASAQLQKIGAYLQAHQEELATKNAVFSSALQRASTKYNWFITQYDKLTLMYNEKAQILRGAQPQA